MAGEVDGCHKPEGLPLHCHCVRPISPIIMASLTGGSMLARVCRPWFLSTKVVGERLPEDGRRGLSGRPEAAELLLGRLRAVAGGPAGRTERVISGRPVFLHARVGACPQPRTRYRISIMVFVSAVGVSGQYGVCRFTETRPGASRSEVSRR